MHRDDFIRISHMLQAAKDALEFAEGKSRSDLDMDRMLTLSLVKSVEIIGEAASRVSREIKENSKTIPWSDIIAMRNRLIHVYFDINLDRVWDTVTSDLPNLIEELERIVASEKQLIEN